MEVGKLHDGEMILKLEGELQIIKKINFQYIKDL
jgi:hypothetical protein